MKKATALILALTLLLSLTACGKQDVSGLGIMDMNTGASTSGGIGTLGKPSGGAQPTAPTSAPTEAPMPTEVPMPTEAPAPTQAPAPAGLSTERYSNELFSCMIPSGWDVYAKAYDADGGMTRMLVFITDPADPNNMIFYVQALEPFFANADSKNSFCRYFGSGFDWAPVLADGLSAESVLRQWPTVYCFMDAQGSLDLVKFKNYMVRDVLQTYSADSSSYGVSSGVLAEVSISDASTTYAMYLENTLAASTEPYYSITYYISYGNLGFVIDPELYNSYLDTFAMCKNSFDFSGFLDRYSVAAESNGGSLLGDIEYVPMS